jgi:4-amino-4-deoxy-L-arabinose transferase-like glycosyltransferase
MTLGFAVRLALGLRIPLDPGEATLGIAAVHLLHGQLVFMNPDGQYLGALDAYLVAPFVAVLGTSLAAIRIALSFVGALSVLAAYWFGRIAFRRESAAVAAAVATAVFPLFAVYWSARLHPGAADLVLLETVCLSAAALIGWGRGRLVRWWALLGFAVGLGVWSDLLFLCVAMAIAGGLLLRAPRIGWGQVGRGALVASVAALAGMLPLLVFNLPSGLAGLHAIPRTAVGLGTRFTSLFSEQLPIFVGGSSGCGHPVIPAVATDIALLVLVLALLWNRRLTLQYMAAGHWTGLSSIDVALIAIPVTIAAVLLSGVDAQRCVPHALLPMAVPLALGITSILTERARWQWLALAIAAVWLVISAVAAAGTLPDTDSRTSSGTAIPGDLGPGVALLQHHHPGAVWAEYGLSRLLSYFSNDTLPIGAYGGYAGFIARQQEVETALDPSWVFVAGDPHIASFLNACRTRSISYAAYTGGGLVLYTDLNGSIEPDDVFTGAEARTA